MNWPSKISIFATVAIGSFFAGRLSFNIPHVAEEAVTRSPVPMGQDEEAAERQGRVDIVSALNSARRMKASPSQRELIEGLYRNWGSISPSEALQSLQHLPLTEKRPLEAAVLAGWVLTDPNAAWEWVGDNPYDPATTGRPNDQEWRYAGLIEALLTADRADDAMKLVRQNPAESLGGPERLGGPGPHNLVVRHLTEYNFETALAWLSSETLPLSRTNIASTIAQVLAEKSPEAGADFAFSLPNDVAIVGILSAFWEWGTAGDLYSAEQFLSRQEQGRNVDVATRALISRAILRDLDFAVRLVTTIGDPSIRADAIDTSARALNASDFSRRADWIVATTDIGSRAGKLTPIISSWVRVDPEAAAQYIMSEPRLSEMERHALLPRAQR